MNGAGARDVLLEVCLDSAESARAAETGGARRVELCARLDLGGVTPSFDLLRRTRDAVTIALHVMIRPRGGDFVYSAEEILSMKADIAVAKAAGADGVVFGVLRPDRTVDRTLLSELVALARPLAVTFHRAFDEAAEPLRSLDDIIAGGADILLTSGQKPVAPEGLPLLGELARHAAGRIVVMPGSGVTGENAPRILAETGARAIHVGSAVHDRPGGVVQASLVKKFLERVRKASLS